MNLKRYVNRLDAVVMGLKGLGVLLMCFVAVFLFLGFMQLVIVPVFGAFWDALGNICIKPLDSP